MIIPAVYLLTTQTLEGYNLTIPLSLAIFSVGWLLRGRLDPTRNQDFSLFLLFLLWKFYKRPQLDWIWPVSLWSLALPILVTATSLAVAVARFTLRDVIFNEKHKGGLNSGSAVPLILPSRTTHTRFFPKRHSFSYSYLQVSVPVEFEGRCGSLLSVGESLQRGWFHVQASDYLNRTSENLSLKAKLSAYLQSQVWNSFCSKVSN
jgi:hypothetical protein